MSLPTFELTGSAISGILVDGEQHRRAVAALPTTVKLGRRPPTMEAKKRMVHLGDFFDRTKAPPPPPSTNWREKAAPAIARMYKNDQLGCCVWSSNLHLLGVTSANDSDSGGIILATDQEVVDQYHRVCGPGDNGCVITDTLDWGMRNGWVAGGKTYKIQGYCAVDWTDKLLVQTVQLISGASKIGIALPEQWMSSDVWDNTSSRIVGGHDVLPIDYDEQGVYVASWGRIYLMTWRAFLSSRWVGEYYFVRTDTWTGPDKMSPAGFDLAGLDAAFEKLKGGGTPDWNPPTPPPPPPPAPASYPSYEGPISLSFHLPLFGTVAATGTASLKPVLAGRSTLGGLGGLNLPPWLLPLILKYGNIVVPIVLQGLLSGKSWPQILQEILAALLASGVDVVDVHAISNQYATLAQ